MALSLASISHGRAIKAPRVILLGVEKVGKSTLASQADAPIFIPMKGEQGIDQINCAKFPPAMNYDDIIESIGVLYREEHDYKTVVIDSTSAAEPLIWEKVCKAENSPSIEKVGGGYGKGYIETLRYWREIMDGLDALREERGMGCILIGHVKAKEINDPEADNYTAYIFDIQDRAANALYRWADAVLFTTYKKAIVQKTEAGFKKTTSRATGTGQRVIYTEKRPSFPAGNRYGLPFEMKMDWAEIKSNIAASQSPATVAKEVEAPLKISN